MHKLLFYVIINKKSSSAETRITFVILNYSNRFITSPKCPLPLLTIVFLFSGKRQTHISRIARLKRFVR